ncbi:hypothetical protein V6N13_113591 [Hibiscus sabdariffa]|uniref:Uncharacterized protein n=1 Tax=Hibiscus sabdariffa TaxID=183260 RepID=A0ABR2TZR4_9ROSI
MAGSTEETVVPNSLLSKGTVEKIWTGIRDLSKCEVGSEHAHVVSGPVNVSLLNNERAKIAKKVEYKGQQRKVSNAAGFVIE